MVLVALKNMIFGNDREQCRSRKGFLPLSDKDIETLTSDTASETSTSTLCASPTSERSRDSKSTSSRVDPRIISDATIGLSDGLTVPFALTAGLSALGDARIVIYGGLAELIAGAISMGLGGWLGAKSEVESYNSTYASVSTLVKESPSSATALINETFEFYDLPTSLLHQLSSHLTTRCSSATLTHFLLHHHHGLSEPETTHALRSGLTIAASYFIGGFIPLLPYLWFWLFSTHSPEATDPVAVAFGWSVAVMIVALFVFGWVKTALIESPDEQNSVYGRVSSQAEVQRRSWSRRWKCMKGGMQMVIMGGVAAAAATGMVKAFGT